MIHRLTIQFLPCQIAHNGNAHKQGLSNEEGQSAEVGNGKREVKTERDKEQREGGEEGWDRGRGGREEGRVMERRQWEGRQYTNSMHQRDPITASPHQSFPQV